MLRVTFSKKRAHGHFKIVRLLGRKISLFEHHALTASNIDYL